MIIKKNFLRNFAGAWIFYTIFPKFPLISPKFKNIAQFAPALGIIIGSIQCAIFYILINNSWPILACSSICICSGYFITGGLHIDGLMDTFDGLYAGKKKLLKAMKDSRVGSFGVQAVVVITLIQLASITKLGSNLLNVLPICLFWGRFSTLVCIDKFKYLSYKKKSISISHKNNWKGLKRESSVSLFCLFLIIIYYLFSISSIQGIFTFIIFLIFGLLCSLQIPKIIGNKIGGFNGDSCGASVVITETTILFISAIFL